MAASNYYGRRFQEISLPAALCIPAEVLPNTQFLVGRFNPYLEVKPGKRVVLEYFSCPFKCPNWNFLLEHQETFQSNPRMNLMLSNLCHLAQRKGL